MMMMSFSNGCILFITSFTLCTSHLEITEEYDNNIKNEDDIKIDLLTDFNSNNPLSAEDVKIRLKSGTIYDSKIDEKSTSFTYKNDTIVQQIIIYKRPKSKIYFEYSCENTLRKIRKNISGEAILKKEGDAEIGEDELGNAYLLNEYICNADNYTVFVGVSAGYDKVTIQIGDCEDDILNADIELCPINSVAILRKLK